MSAYPFPAAAPTGTAPSSDPTAVMGRRYGAWVVDALLYLLLMSFLGPTPLSPLAEYYDTDSIPGDDACEVLQDSEGVDAVGCLKIGDRAYVTDGTDAAVQALVALAWFLLVYGAWQGLRGLTPGKALFGVAVVDEHGRPPGVGRSLARTVLWIVDGAPWCIPLVGPIVAGTSKGHRRVGDMAAKTFVVGKNDRGRPVVVPGLTTGYGAGYGAPYGAPPPGYGGPGQGWGAPGGPPGGPGGQGGPGGPGGPPQPSWGATPPAAPGAWGQPAGPGPERRPAPPASGLGGWSPPGAASTTPVEPTGPAGPPGEPGTEERGAPPERAEQPPAAGAEAPEQDAPTGPTPAPTPTPSPAPAQAQPTPAATQPQQQAAGGTGYNPQWDAARNTYIVWDPNRGRWLGWDDGAKEWRPL